MEGGGEGFDQHGSTDGSLGDTDVVLGEGENVVPEASFLVVLHFRKIKVWTGPSLDEFTSVMEEVESKIEDGTGKRGIVNGNPRFVEVPSSRTEKRSLEYTACPCANSETSTYRTIKTAGF